MTTLSDLWDEVGFTPNSSQERAIRHLEGPLYLPAGPGSGKTRVLLWRTVNLIVFHHIPPDEIFLSTFTEKAAQQLQEGLRGLLVVASAHTGVPYDLAGLYVGTVHSLCHRLLQDRRLRPRRERGQKLTLRDELSQYLSLYPNARWTALTEPLGGSDPIRQINTLLANHGKSSSRHLAVTHCLAWFNRLSEECLDPEALLRSTPPEEALGVACRLYQNYRQRLTADQATDLSLLQQHALDLLRQHPGAGRIFRHVILDEYQDTNTVQERLFFALADGHRNLCVVGDDDQALYRFRGATVENFVYFPVRCQRRWRIDPVVLPLLTNYRSRASIVAFYRDFIQGYDWHREGGGSHRVVKRVQSHDDDPTPAIALSTGAPDQVCAEVAATVKRLLDSGKVEDPNQIAFLFPSLKSTAVSRLRKALEKVGLHVYAPRAGRFLEGDEAIDLLGLYLLLLGKPPAPDEAHGDWGAFHRWLETLQARGEQLRAADPALARFLADREQEMHQALADEDTLLAVVERHGWDLAAPYDLAAMNAPLRAAPGLSPRAQRALGRPALGYVVRTRQQAGDPLTLRAVLARLTTLDWSLLDLFWRLTGFQPFRARFDAAQHGTDEAPLFNLGILSQYISRYMEEYRAPLVTAGGVRDGRLRNRFFLSYLYALFRRGESEYESVEDPFPKGRLPFLTIHQAKGLEFPVVILGTLDKRDFGPSPIENGLDPYLPAGGEPLARRGGFDILRMFYVALSRPQQLLILMQPRGQGLRTHRAFSSRLLDSLPRLADLDLDRVPATPSRSDDMPHTYSYTGDYLAYQRCPRQYLFFRRYGLVPVRSQVQLFGSLVHRTLEDLHQHLIGQREAGA